MDWKKLTLADVCRLVQAIEQAGGNAETVIGDIINRTPPVDLTYGRVTMESLLNLLAQTAGSTWLPERIVAQLNAPEPGLAEPIADGSNQSFAQLLAACRQDSVNPDFTEEHFPLVDDGTGTLPVEEYCFGRGIVDREAVAELAKLGLKPVGIKRAMEYIATHPDAQLDHIILVIGAQWMDDYGHIRAPYFYQERSQREIHFTTFDGHEYHDRVHFLVVRLPARSAGG